MYTLGIILFEMAQPPFDTSMERAQTIMALRSANIVIPEKMLVDSKNEKTIKVRNTLARCIWTPINLVSSNLDFALAS